ncbi:MAG: hypothetical protein HYX72_11030 [Acidobacteria bacterium]|nr:hypothetical protein [Acidobacteriota bacterium]
MPLPKRFATTYLMCESKKGISANQLKRTLKVSYKTAWYLCHRIRKAMAEMNPPKLNGTVEVDKMFVQERSMPGPGTYRLVVVQPGPAVRFPISSSISSGSMP